MEKEGIILWAEAQVMWSLFSMLSPIAATNGVAANMQRSFPSLI
jgi:hypothetical protein